MDYKNSTMYPHAELMEKYAKGFIDILQVALADEEYNELFNKWLKDQGLENPTARNAMEFYDLYLPH